MPLTVPPGVDVAGRRNAIFTPTQSLSVAVLGGATSVELICYLTKGTLGVAAETERGTDERECSTQTFEVLGNTTWTFNALDYVWEPQAAALAAGNKAYETLVAGTTGFITLRFGVLNDTALTIGQKVWQFPVTLGAQVPKTPEGSAAEKIKITQEVVITGTVVRDGVLVA
jgi:hypothetical protein